jgi:hypothetical protein
VKLVEAPEEENAKQSSFAAVIIKPPIQINNIRKLTG